MKFNSVNTVIKTEGSLTYLAIEVPNNLVDKIKSISDKECTKVIEFKQYREKRSLNANSYAWTIINKIAVAIRSTDEEVYINLLHKYGTKEYIACLPNIIPELKKVFRLVETLGATTINGKRGVTLRLIRGSSSYDVLEMSKFVNGIVDDAEILGICTMTPQEINRLMKNYEGS
ncbi:hypothetical protein N9924_00880 [bacterium]|nr:hypothetical protein [bacterium]